MSLEKIYGSYDAIYSLGDVCLSAMKLKQFGLRNTSGVMDWIATPNISDVIRFFENDFKGFMEKENLRIIGYATEKFICVSDDHYSFVSNHDFPTPHNTLTSLPSYLEVKAKYNRRIKRFQNSLKTNKKILFVRTEGQFEEMLALQETLAKIITHDFRVLVVNHTDVHDMVVKNWPLSKVCMVEFPNLEKWEGNNALWEKILTNVHLRG